MRFFTGILVALLFVAALLIFTRPEVPQTGGLPNAQRPASPVSEDSGNRNTTVLEVGRFALDVPTDWQEMSRADLEAFPELANFGAYFDRQSATRAIANSDSFETLSGFALFAPLGRAKMAHLDAMRVIEAKLAENSTMTTVYAARKDRIGTFDGASFAVKMQVPGPIGRRAMQVGFRVLGEGRRNLMVVTMKALGSSGASDLDGMLASLRVE